MTGYKQPPRRRTPEFHVPQTYTILAGLAAQYGQGMTWKAIGGQIGVSGPTVRRAVVLGKYPENNKLRAALGLPVTAPAPVCARCGVVHVRKTCPPDKPSAPRVRRPSRRSLALDVLRMVYDPAAAAGFLAGRERR